MSTDYQKAREALGIRLRELRLSAPGGRLTGTQGPGKVVDHAVRIRLMGRSVSRA
ncbi:hypothetical protein SSP531S_48590 [Streptomyces spongiicola]|uniref:Transcriptional regulator n=1 Tax=Streptomyces spongiicola TaxID=1690221 RepID=A0A388T4D2_9ACTN|nr:hypothetical protein SSP531S_48590 [Streptomyces spongiicola]